MWFARKTACAVTRKSFKTFMHDPRLTADWEQPDQTSRPGSRHRIWVGTDSGLYIYDPRQSISPACRPRHGSRSPSPLILDCDREGRVWIVENGDVFVTIRRPVRSNAATSRGSRCAASLPRTSFGSPAAAAYCTEDLFRTVKPFSTDGGDLSQDIIFIRSMTTTRCTGLEERGAKGPCPERLPAVVGQPMRRCSCAILPYSPEELWIGTESGIVVYNVHPALPASEKPRMIPILRFRQRRIRFARPRGGLWIGSFFGHHYLPQRNSDFENTTDDPHSQAAAWKLPRQRRRLDRHGGCRLYTSIRRRVRSAFTEPEFSNVYGLRMDGTTFW